MVINYIGVILFIEFRTELQKGQGIKKPQEEAPCGTDVEDAFGLLFHFSFGPDFFRCSTGFFS
jgi:hypothetical protein